ncbi:uncharacterized protein LOC100908524 [Galendromus occidentalis]|uniref:Uncharacterized protein LOC100908524 n=1 Tax=Galendromus occidentalis TaxID=34638 RepID=A0AAJ6QW77_9ACAR|nr:uncharacterized protein LOC100908524 [Galendromus occidentalis]
MATDEAKMGKNNGNKESPAADDDWERMIDNGSLDRAIEKLSMKNSPKGATNDSEKDMEEAPKVQVRLEEPPIRTPFTPMVRILKRETASPRIATNKELALSNANGQSAPKNPPSTKTFAQRQDEYARARARIMGNQSANASVVPNGNFRATLLDSSNNRNQDGQLPQQPPQQSFKDRRTNGR